jgi:hypothetical protein
MLLSTRLHCHKATTSQCQHSVDIARITHTHSFIVCSSSIRKVVKIVDILKILDVLEVLEILEILNPDDLDPPSLCLKIRSIAKKLMRNVILADGRTPRSATRPTPSRRLRLIVLHIGTVCKQSLGL